MRLTAIAGDEAALRQQLHALAAGSGIVCLVILSCQVKFLRLENEALVDKNLQQTNT